MESYGCMHAWRTLQTTYALASTGKDAAIIWGRYILTCVMVRKYACLYECVSRHKCHKHLD